MKIVLLSGGSGQRLWPLSNDNCSKQYIKFISHDCEVEDCYLVSKRTEKCSMLQRVYEQLSAAGFENDVIIAASEAQREIVTAQLGDRVLFSSEPMRRDTFPAVLLASSFVKTECNCSEDEVIVFVPVDPYVTLEYFKKIKELGELVKTHKNVIGLMGAKPTYPSEKYGYIVMQESDLNGIQVKGFEEKPSLEKAEKLVENNALWNCGVFCFTLHTAELWARKYNMEFDFRILSKEENYEKLPKISFDYEILEKSENRIAITYNGMWKDIGTWNTLTEEMTETTIGNAIIDETSINCRVLSTLDTPVIVMGGQDLIVAASNDGILVTDKEQSSYLKQQLAKTVITPRYEERRWGTIKTLDRSVENGVGVITNMVKVEEGKATTYHKHNRHEEIITIISGEGFLIINNSRVELKQGMTFSISRKEFHLIKAEKQLRYIEILMGEINGDDIERVEGYRY